MTGQEQAPPTRAGFETDRFAVIVLPSLGASIARLAWRHPDGDWRELLDRPSEAAIDDVGASLSRLSSFIMAPFANRIDQARFSFEGGDYALPLNRPQQSCAIHGLSRELAWDVVEQSDHRIALTHGDARSDTPYRYRARHGIGADDASLWIDLAVENVGDVAMPFGFGLHPWFMRTPATTLQFVADATFESDERTFPTSMEDITEALDFRTPVVMETRQGMDRHYAGWSGVARIAHPDLGYAIDVSSDEAEAGIYKNLHIFCPANRAAFCVEPVTHVTDVVNRRQFAPFGDMTRLAPGESLRARVRLTPSTL